MVVRFANRAAVAAGAVPGIGPGRPVPTLQMCIIQKRSVLRSLPLELPQNIRALPKECVLRTVN